MPSRLLDAKNRLQQIRIGGAALPDAVAAAATKADMSYSSTQTTELKLSVQDTPDGTLWNLPLLRRGVSLDYGDQQLVIRTVSIEAGAGGPTVAIVARSRVIAALRKQTGKRSWGTADISSWVRDRVKEAGGIAVVQPGLGSESITRQDGNEEESSWDVMQRLTSAAGAVAYEVDQRVVFARPSWLEASGSGRRWSWYWNSTRDYSDLIAAVPRYRGSDDGETAEQLTLDLWGSDADQVRPGDGAAFGGRVGEAAGQWLVTQVDIPGAVAKPITVSLERATDPKITKSS